MLPTGPRTEEGKAHSSQNAIKHGAFAKTIVLPGESQEEFDRLHAGLIHDHNPIGETENNHVRGLAEIQWRLNRLRQWEAVAVDQALESGDLDCKCLLNYTLIEQRLLRNFQTTLKLLKDAQAPRLAELEQQFRSACDIRQVNLECEIDWTPESDGFVFSLQEIDAAISRRKALEYAARTLKASFHPVLEVKLPLKKAA